MFCPWTPLRTSVLQTPLLPTHRKKILRAPMDDAGGTCCGRLKKKKKTRKKEEAVSFYLS